MLVKLSFGILPEFFNTSENAVSTLIALDGFIVLTVLSCIVTLAIMHLKKRNGALQRENRSLVARNKSLSKKHTYVRQNSMYFARRMLRLINVTDTVNARIESKEQWHAHYQRVKDQSSHLREISDGLFNINDVAQDVLPALSPVNAYNAIERASAIFKTCCITNQKKVEIFNHTNALIDLPKGLLDKLLRRLMSNAIRNSDGLHKVIIKTSTVQGRFYFSIENYGQGIPFKALLQDSTEKSSGLSSYNSQNTIYGVQPLTLKVMSGIIKQFDGAIEVATAIGYCTRIHLSFPVSGTVESKGIDAVANNQLALLNNKSNSHQVSKHQLPKLLIACQSHSAAQVLVNEVGDNFNCKSAVGIEETIARYGAFNPELVLMDHQLSEFGANEVTALLNVINDSHVFLPSIMVLFPFRDQSAKVELLRQGITSVIAAPYDAEEIRLTLNNLSREHQKSTIRIEEAIGSYHSQELSIPNPMDFSELKKRKFVTKFNEVIKENYKRPDFRRHDAAELLHLDIRTLNRRLAECFKHNFVEHLRKFRLQQARLLILEGRLITDVCFTVGFNNQSHFSNAFKKEFSVSPSKL